VRPDFLVIGAQKCATSSLCEQLGAHPNVFMTHPKEPYFFSDPATWARGWAWYERLFAGSEACTARGEGSTTYSMQGLYPWTASRIAEHLPEARLIYIVRDPLERIVSHWMHLRSRQNRETEPFNAAVRGRPEYIDNSRYFKQISVYRALYPAERILILFFDDFRRDPRAVLRRCFTFLGVDPDIEIDNADEPRHASAHGRVDRTALGALRRIPLFGRLRDVAPAPVRDVFQRVLKRPIGARPTWSAENRRWAIDQLRADGEALFALCGKPKDYWGWGA
jgi:hypothetical protein